MTFRASRELLNGMGLAVLLTSALAACGGSDVPPPPEVDAGDADAEPRDAGPSDAAPRDSSIDASDVDAGDVDAGECLDEDGDGRAAASCGGDDCDDTDPTRYPGATEMCDLDDEDCNDATFGVDADGDTYESIACCNGAGNCGPDCDDALNAVNPGGAEQCNGGIDDDCNGVADAADGVCVPCPTGYAGFDGECTNIDECVAGAPCGGAVGVVCMDTTGSYTCTCPAGYTGAAAGGTCSDVDECATGTPCGASATSCTNTPGSYVCACQAGYTAPSTGGACADVDECATASTCGAARTGCTNLPGSYQCACAAGYTAPATGGSCTDVDECATATTCGGGRTGCTNTPGSYVCACSPGYSAPATGGACVDTDECATASTCGGGRTGCTNLVGSYVCVCAAGYSAPAMGGTCADVDECATATTCGSARTGCANSVGSYACTCAAGYSAPATGGTCTDVNECPGAPCGAGAISCSNTPGSYACTCSSGYSAPATGGTCADINECTSATDDCDDDPVATCGNTAGGYVCGCPTDFGGSGHGAAGCVLTNASLASLVPSVGALSPAFDAATTTEYTLTLPPGATTVTLTPAVAYPTHAVIRVNGVIVASGAPSLPITVVGFAPTSVAVTVTPDGGPMRMYSVVIVRSSAYIKASNTGANDNFGWSVSLSQDGTRLAVGAWREDSSAVGVGGDQADNAASNSGAVYVFSRTGTTWTQEAYIKASNTAADDSFGISISLSADGTRLAVGANLEDSSATGIGGNQADDTAVNSGAVYVFSRTGTTWTQEAYVKASNTSANDNFGYPVSLTADGTRLVVSANGEDSSAVGVGGNQADNAASNSGAMYVFSRTGTTWAQEAYVKASNTGAGDAFGWSVALAGDGTRLVAGANAEDSSAVGVGGNQADNTALNSGAAYVFSRTGTTWTQEAYVKASNTELSDFFGQAVALTADGTRLVVAAYLEASSATGIGGSQTDNAAGGSGAVYVFSRTGTTWTQEAYVKASNTSANDNFGQSVSLSADGTRLVVAAHLEDSAATGIDGSQTDNAAGNGGAVYVFSRTGTTWAQEAYVKASNTGANDNFGWSVTLSANGTRLAVGATLEDSSATGIDGDQLDNSAFNSGAVYVF